MKSARERYVKKQDVNNPQVFCRIPSISLKKITVKNTK